jgi:hypothetical protein
LPLQIRDLLFGIRDLLLALDNLFFAFGYFTTEFLNLSQQPFIFPLQLFTAGLLGMPMAIRRCSLSPCASSVSRTHPPYVKRFGWICPEKSIGVPELLPDRLVNKRTAVSR